MRVAAGDLGTVGSARCGAIGAGQTRWMEMKVFGPGTLWFYWKHTPGDQSILRFETDGNEPHSLLWQYTKDGSGSDGDDCGWVDTLKCDGSAEPAAAEWVMVRVSEPIGRPRIERRTPAVYGFRKGPCLLWGQSRPQFSESDA